MRERVARQIHSIRGAVLFARDERGGFPPIRRLSETLEAHLRRIMELTVQETITKHHGRDTGRAALRHAAEEVRRKDIIPIVRAGKRIFRMIPGKEGALVVPPTRATPAEVAKAARKTLKAIRGARKLFLEIGFEPDFFQACERRTKALEALVAGRHRHREERPGVLSALAAEVAAARGIIDVMDGHIKASGDTLLIHGWNMCKRVGKRKGRPLKPRGAKARLLAAELPAPVVAPVRARKRGRRRRRR